jgi:hypothetical protein
VPVDRPELEESAIAVWRSSKSLDNPIVLDRRTACDRESRDHFSYL